MGPAPQPLRDPALRSIQSTANADSPCESREIRAIVRGLERFTSKLITKITLDVTANLVKATPVDTGWARANWVPAIGQAANPIQPEGGTRTSAEVAGARARQSAATPGVLRYNVRQGRVVVSNNVPYIESLNTGHSKPGARPDSCSARSARRSPPIFEDSEADACRP